VFTPFLVHARTAPIDAPQDTVRALLNTGRGRQSDSRGLCLLASAATLPRISSLNFYTLIHYRVKAYKAKRPKAVESLVANWERLVTRSTFAKHWKHLRTTNVIESPFATVRLRERVTRG